MPRAGKEHRRTDRRKAFSGARALRALLLAVAVASLPGCSRRGPQAAFDHARQTLRNGDAAAAALQAEKGYNDFRAAGPEWAWRFTILRAWALHSRGLNDDVLKLLNSESVPPPTSELSVQKLRWQGVAYASLHKFAEADQRFGEAERVCAVSDYPACADVVDARGRLEMERGHYAQAQSLFGRVLV